MKCKHYWSVHEAQAREQHRRHRDGHRRRSRPGRLTGRRRQPVVPEQRRRVGPGVLRPQHLGEQRQGLGAEQHQVPHDLLARQRRPPLVLRPGALPRLVRLRHRRRREEPDLGRPLLIGTTPEVPLWARMPTGIARPEGVFYAPFGAFFDNKQVLPLLHKT